MQEVASSLLFRMGDDVVNLIRSVSCYRQSVRVKIYSEILINVTQ